MSLNSCQVAQVTTLEHRKIQCQNTAVVGYYSHLSAIAHHCLCLVEDLVVVHLIVDLSLMVHHVVSTHHLYHLLLYPLRQCEHKHNLSS